MSGQSGGRIRLSKLNDQLTCRLCRGYFIDATTIIECLHSFCRSCIVKYLETTKYCPICEVQVHKSKPLLNIRPDHTLQDIVYKLVPGCYQNEMRCRREFYEMHPEAQLTSMSPEARGEPIESHIYSPDESLSLSLEYYNPNVNDGPMITMDETTKESSNIVALTAATALTLASTPTNLTTSITTTTNTNTTTTAITTSSSTSSSMTPVTGKYLPRRYLRCPAAVTVFHLQKLIRAKYGLSDAHRVDVMYKEESLCENYTLMDVMYIYHWRRKVPLHLSYRIFESSPKRLKLADDNVHFKESLTNAGISSIEPKDENLKREWKEVQLKISETGVMSVTGITSPESKKVSAQESLEDEQRRLDESVAAAVVAITDNNKKSSSNTNESKSQLTLDINSKKHGNELQQEQQHNTQRNNEKSNDSSTDNLRKNNEVKTPIEVKQITTSNNNNNSNNNNYNSVNESALNLDSREKHKSNTTTVGNEMSKNYQSSSSSSSSSSPSGSGSKIDALSVKLQFQPKVGQVNNTYSKKTQKDKTMLEKVLKKSENRNLFKDGQIEMKNFSDKQQRAIIRTPIGITTTNKSSTNFSSKITTIGQSQCTISSSSSSGSGSSTSSDLLSSGTNTITPANSTISTPSVSISITSQKNLSPDRNKESTVNSYVLSSNLHKCSRRSSSENTENSNQRSISNQINTSQSHNNSGTKNCYVRQNNNPSLNTEGLANIGLNVSTAFIGMGSSSSSTGTSSSTTFPYTVQDLVNNAILKSPSKNLGNTCGQKQNIIGNVNVSASASHQTNTTSNIPFNIQTPSMSVYSIPNMTNKNNTSVSSNSNNNSSTGSSNSKNNSKVNLEITTVYSVPPCPDAIPISMMKPTIRKSELTAKGTNINDICAKIGTSGSKINDICAKIGESSKEKNKNDTRLRPEIPDLLKITKKTMSSVTVNDNTAVKHIPNIPNVPIYTPTNSVSSSDSRSVYMNKDTSKMMSMTTATPTTTTITTMATGISSIASTTTNTTTTSTNTTTISTNTTTTTSTSSMMSTTTATSLESTISTSGSSNISLSSSSASTTTSGTGVTTSIAPSTSSLHQISARSNSMKRSQSQSVGYKTLRDPPKSWNPTLSKNNYVAAKNQAKEQLNQLQPASLMSELSGGDANNCGKNSITSKPAKIFKMRNMPRYLGNPASGVKPMYGHNNEGKDNKDQSITLITSKNNVSSGLSMTKIDPKTLSPIISTNTNSPIVSPPPYSPNARSYQNTPFSRSGNSPLSPRNSPVNMLSTNPFIPSPTPNTNPRLIYSHFIPFPDGSRFNNPLIRSPIGIPPPSAFHSSLPPSINKLYQRSSYMPQTTCATYVQQQGLNTQPPTVQRIPPSTHSSSPSSSSSSSSSPSSSSSTTSTLTSTSSSSSSSSPKSPKTTVTSSTYNSAKGDTQTSIPTSSDINNVNTTEKQTEQNSNAFNLCKMTPATVASQTNYVSDLSRTSVCNDNDNENQNKNDNEDKNEEANKNDGKERVDEDFKKNIIGKEKNKIDDGTRISNEEKGQKHDQKDKIFEKEVKKNKKNKRKDKIILKEINIKRQLRDSHCIVSMEAKNLLSKNGSNEQVSHECDDNSTSNANKDQQSSITKEITRAQNLNLSDSKTIISNQHQTMLIDDKKTDQVKDINKIESKNSLTENIFSKNVNDNNEKKPDAAKHEELIKNDQQHAQTKISEIQINKAES